MPRNGNGRPQVTEPWPGRTGSVTVSDSSAAPRKRYNFDDPEFAAMAARAAHVAMAPKRFEDRIAKIVAEAPPLTAEQRIRIAALLLTAGERAA